MLLDHVNHGIRASTALALRHTPDVKGRWHIALAVNKIFAPLSQSFCTVSVPMRLGHRMQVDLRAFGQFHAYYLGDFDNRAIHATLRVIRQDSVILDVGANVGFWTVPLAMHLNGSGCLHAFEPVPANFQRLVANVRQNTSPDQIHLHELGLSDQNGSLPICLRDDFEQGAETGNAAIVIGPEDLVFDRFTIQVNRLDDIFDSLGVDRIDFIKADIEGHEHRFLAGAVNTIRRFRPILFVEINQVYYKRQNQDGSALFQQWLESNSYRAALYRKGEWRLDIVRNCKAFEDAFFFPSETAVESVRRANRRKH
jgi:FkbM family methyltransferase